MNNKYKEISLLLDNDVASAMITMFGQLTKQEDKKEIKISEDGKTVSIREKENTEILKFDFEYQELRFKIYNWFQSGIEWLHLNEKESILFRKCSHAAYYYLLEEPLTNEQIKRNHFIRFHERFFKG